MKVWLSNTARRDVPRIKEAFPGWGLIESSPKETPGYTAAKLLAMDIVGLYREEPDAPKHA
jgi:hypothetical protein